MAIFINSIFFKILIGFVMFVVGVLTGEKLKTVFMVYDVRRMMHLFKQKYGDKAGELIYEREFPIHKKLFDMYKKQVKTK